MREQQLHGAGDWAIALGIAVALHGVLAWLWLLTTPPLSPPNGGRGGVTLGTLAWRGGDNAPLRAESAATAPAIPALPAPPAEPATPLPPPQRMAEPRPAPRTGGAAATASDRAQTRGRKAAAASPRPSERPSVRSTAEAEAHDLEGGRSGAAAGPDGTAGVDRDATPLPNNPRPVYPMLARRQGIEGRVLIRVAVRQSGQVGDVDIARSSGSSLLDDAALRAVRRWRFHPALRSGQAITATITVPVVFRLEG